MFACAYASSDPFFCPKYRSCTLLQKGIISNLVIASKTLGVLTLQNKMSIAVFFWHMTQGKNATAKVYQSLKLHSVQIRSFPLEFKLERTCIPKRKQRSLMIIVMTYLWLKYFTEQLRTYLWRGIQLANWWRFSFWQQPIIGVRWIIVEK